MNNTWSIVVTAKTTVENINIFIKHHLKMGVDNIYLFLDAPQDFDEKEEFIVSDQVEIFKCNDRFWKNREHFECLRYSKGEKPHLVEYRQYHNMLHAHSICDSEWILMMDIDELLYARDSVNKVLNKYPENIFSILVKPIEAIYEEKPPLDFLEVFNGKYFKIHNKETTKKWNEIYNNAEIKHKAGFYGHITGKTFFRTGYPIKSPSCHVSKPYENDLGIAFIEENFLLMHFEAQTPEYFSQKIKNRANKTFNIGFLDQPSVQRTQNIILNYNIKGESYLLDIYNYMHVLASDQLKNYIDAGLILKIEDKYKNLSMVYKKILSHHGEIFVLDKRALKIIAINEKDFDHLKYSYINIVFNLTREDIKKSAFLYTMVEGQIKYLYVNRDGFLISYNKNKAQFLDVLIQNNLFSLQFEDKFLSARKDGSLKFMSEWQKDWELFSLSNLEY